MSVEAVGRVVTARAAILDALDRACFEGVEAVEALARDVAVLSILPPAVLAAFDFLLRHGAAKHGCEPHVTGGGQDVADHMRHGLDHLWNAQVYGVDAVDAETGRLELEHAMVRLGLAVALLRGGQ